MTYHGTVFPFRRLLVTLAGRESDAGLLRYANMLHGLLPVEETICLHVVDPDRPAQQPPVIEPLVAELLPEGRAEVVSGDVLDSVLAMAEGNRSDVILVGHASGRRRRSLARRLAMKAPCSVWMIPDQSTAKIERILAPIDFSRKSADTLSAATALAELARQDECIAVHVAFNTALVTFDDFDEILAEDRDRAWGIFVAPINLHGVWVKPMFLDCPNVAQTIIRVAAEQGTDLIVMGTRGRSPSAAVLLGSETEQCMMTTTVPLLAIKHFGARLSLMQALRDERLRKRGDDRFT
jgi:nucleotide-binding universal stress UspA family protein